MDIGIKINCYYATQCDVGVPLHSRIHPPFMPVVQ